MDGRTSSPRASGRRSCSCRPRPTAGRLHRPRLRRDRQRRRSHRSVPHDAEGRRPPGLRRRERDARERCFPDSWMQQDRAAGGRAPRADRPGRRRLWVRRQRRPPFTPAAIAFAADFVPLGVARRPASSAPGRASTTACASGRRERPSGSCSSSRATSRPAGTATAWSCVWGQDGTLLGSGSQTAAMRYLSTRARRRTCRGPETNVGVRSSASDPRPRAVPPRARAGGASTPRSSRSTTTSSSRPTCSRAACRRRCRTGRRRSWSTSRATRCGSSTGSATRQVGMNAVAGRRPETVEVEPFRFDQMRPGCFDVDARVHDMDLNGVWASLSFPSMITGFCGRVYSQCSDPELGLATTRGVQRLDARRLVAAPPGPHHPARHHLAVRSRARAPRRSGATPHAGSARSRCPSGRTSSGYPSIFDRLLGADPAGVRGDRTRWSACTSARRGWATSSAGLRRARSCRSMATLFGQLSLTACTEWLWAG